MPTEADYINGVKAPGKFAATVGSESDARRIVQQALPIAQELPPGIVGQPYSNPPQGVKSWFQVHPAEPEVGNMLPHIKYADWTGGKKGSGGTCGHLFSRRHDNEGQAMSVMFEVLYESPADSRREAVISERVGELGGRLTYREEPNCGEGGAVCLTYEFPGFHEAQEAASRLRSQGEHVEGPASYSE